MEIFEELFRKSKGRPITYRAKTLHLMDKLRIRNGDRFRVVIEELNSDWKQGVSLSLSKGRIRVADREFSKGIVLWEDTAPVSTEVIIVLGSRQVEWLYLKNVWDKGDGVIDSWHNGAAMIIEELSERTNRYRCNDGYPDDDFNDIVFRIENLPNLSDLQCT